MTKPLPQLLLEAENRLTDLLEPFDGTMAKQYPMTVSALKIFLRDTILSILSEAEKATEVGEKRGMIAPPVNSGLYQMWVGAEHKKAGFNDALSQIKSLWTEWRGNLK